jgi:DNA modification methylase
MDIKCEYTELVEVHKLVPHPKNPNTHSKEQIERLAKIIDFQGQRSPVTVSKNSGFIVVGHGRLDAMKKLGWEKVAVDYQDFNDEAEEYAHLTADNAIGSWSDLDLSRINNDFLDFGPDLDIDLLGIKDFVIEPIEKLDPQCDEDEVPELKEEPVTKRGDIWLLGNHRVMCGDSTMIDDVEKLMNGEKADMVFTDPPYGVDYSGGIQFTKEGVKKDQREKLENDHSEEIYTNSVPVMAAYCNGPIYTWYADSKGKELYNAISENGDYHAMIVWVKNGGYGALNATYKQKHEPCVFWKPFGKKLNFVGPTTENTIWEINKDGKNKLHPTQKPVELSDRAIRNHKADLVLDLFLGSGSTLIGAEKNKRKCYGMELDEHYCDVIVNRWQKYTGKEAVLEATGQKYSELTQCPEHIKGANDVSEQV